MLTPFDDYPIHQTPLPLAQAGGGHSDFYDRFWFNGYTEDWFFALAMGTYPNRGVIDSAFSVVHDGVQRSVFASGRAPFDRSETAVGPLRVEIVEPMRTTRLIVDAPDQQMHADLTFRTRTAAFEEPRQTRYHEARLAMDVTRATQLGSWSGTVEVGGVVIPVDDGVRGTKDRSWGVRPVGDPAPKAPIPTAGQWFFLWAPLHFDDECLHYMVFEDEHGEPWSEVAAVLPAIGEGDRVAGGDAGFERLHRIRHDVRWAPGLRRSDGAMLRLTREPDAAAEIVELEPCLTFRMSGVGYAHPRFAHGRWHDELIVDGEVHPVGELDDVEPRNVHVQQVMRAKWGDRVGIGVLEQLAVGPHRPSGLSGIFDGAGS